MQRNKHGHMVEREDGVLKERPSIWKEISLVWTGSHVLSSGEPCGRKGWDTVLFRSASARGEHCMTEKDSRWSVSRIWNEPERNAGRMFQFSDGCVLTLIISTTSGLVTIHSSLLSSP